MKTRAASAVLTTLLLSTLVGCGESSDPAAALTHACRVYLLGGGAGDQGQAKDLDTIMAGIDAGSGPTYQANEVKKSMVEIRAGAAAGGAVTGLSDHDFKLFGNLASAAARIDRAVQPDSQVEGLNRPDVDALVAAVKAVHARCD